MPFDPLSFGVQLGTSLYSMYSSGAAADEEQRLRELGIKQVTAELGKFPALEAGVKKMYGEQTGIIGAQQGRSIYEAYKEYEGQYAKSGFSGAGALNESFANQKESIGDVYSEKLFGAKQEREKGLSSLEDWKRNLRTQRAAMGYDPAAAAMDTLGKTGGGFSQPAITVGTMVDYIKYRTGGGTLEMDKWALGVKSGEIANANPTTFTPQTSGKDYFGYVNDWVKNPTSAPNAPPNTGIEAMDKANDSLYEQATKKWNSDNQAPVAPPVSPASSTQTPSITGQDTKSLMDAFLKSFQSRMGRIF